MIARISGKVIEYSLNRIVIDSGNGICYEVMVSQPVIDRLEVSIPRETVVNLFTYHYFQVEPSRSTPVIIGFLTEIEKEFFEAIITVSGIGPRAAVRALNKPVSLIAKAIDEADVVFLKSLPGIGEQRAKEIIAKLQKKVGKFGLIQDKQIKEKDTRTSDIQEEAVKVLLQLEYRNSEAVLMIKKAFENSPRIETTEELLNEVYKQRRIK